eukprot:gene1521-biopygen26461
MIMQRAQTCRPRGVTCVMRIRTTAQEVRREGAARKTPQHPARRETTYEHTPLLPVLCRTARSIFPKSRIPHPDQDARRPADVFLRSWVRRCPAAFDFAVTSPHRGDVQLRAADAVGAAAADYEGFTRTFKGTADQCALEGITFIPMIFEPSGGWGPSAADVFRRLIRVGDSALGEDRSRRATQHRQKWCVLVRRLAARRVLRRLPGGALPSDFLCGCADPHHA